MSASVDNTLLDLLNSSYPTQPHSLIAKYMCYCPGVTLQLILLKAGIQNFQSLLFLFLLQML